jgi:hypothetical protein
MSLTDALIRISIELEENQIEFALIGGLALAAHGVVRATIDIDFLVHGNQKKKVKEIFLNMQYRVANETENVLQVAGEAQVDMIFANRPLSQDMLKSADKISGFPCPVVKAEDIIGLKVQAYKNDLTREYQDKADIQALITNNDDLNWDKINEYASLFGEERVINELKIRAGK